MIQMPVSSGAMAVTDFILLLSLIDVKRWQVGLIQFIHRIRIADQVSLDRSTMRI